MTIIMLIISILILFLSIFVIGSANPVHSVCFLILIYLISSLIMFTIGQDFLAIVYIIVYIGAIMILFLFIIMMLNIRIIELKNIYLTYVPVGLIFLLIIIYVFYYILMQSSDLYGENRMQNLIFLDKEYYFTYVDWLTLVDYKVTNIQYLGLVLYNKYSLFVIISGFLLFIATIGSILISFVILKDLNK